MELTRLQKQAGSIEAITWLFKLAAIFVNGIGAVVASIFALFSGCAGFLVVLLGTAPVLFFCLLFVVIAAAIH